MTLTTQRVLSDLIRNDFDNSFPRHSDDVLIQVMIEIGNLAEAEQMLIDADKQISLMEFIRKQQQCK